MFTISLPLDQNLKILCLHSTSSSNTETCSIELRISSPLYQAPLLGKKKVPGGINTEITVTAASACNNCLPSLQALSLL